MPLETISSEKAKAYAKKHYLANREKRLAQQTLWRASLTGEAKVRHRAKDCDAARRRAYGITPQQFKTRLEDQGFKCAVCSSDVPGGKGTWKVDHCHSSGEVRGLLCNGCNVGLGHFKDSPSALRSAASYVENAANNAS